MCYGGLVRESVHHTFFVFLKKGRCSPRLFALLREPLTSLLFLLSLRNLINSLNPHHYFSRISIELTRMFVTFSTKYKATPLQHLPHGSSFCSRSP